MGTHHSSSSKGPRSQPRLTGHAVARYLERVEPECSQLTARQRLELIVQHGCSRSTPRHWMRGRVRPAPGLRFLYCAEHPDVCALLIGDAVVTVVSRSMFKAKSAIDRASNGRRRIAEYDGWHWDGIRPSDAEAA
jgi:hypothetical protein